MVSKNTEKKKKKISKIPTVVSEQTNISTVWFWENLENKSKLYTLLGLWENWEKTKEILLFHFDLTHNSNLRVKITQILKLNLE